MKEIKGDLISLAKEGEFDIIVQGCNCFCTMGKGLAPQIKETFPGAWKADLATIKGDMKKLGNYSYSYEKVKDGKLLVVINAYTQYRYNKKGEKNLHLDYDALTIVLKKINSVFAGKSIGVPLIGAGLAGGNWARIRITIIEQLKDMDVTIVYYEK